MDDNVIEIINVKKNYGKKIILEDINLSVSKGQIYGFIGPSGSGKTTLVKLIVGMEHLDKGEINVLNKKIPNLDILQDIGYMAQADSLYGELTGEENLRFFAELFKLKKNEQEKRINYVANLVNLQESLKKKVSSYSGGMKRRLSLALALIQNPKILILDEPTVGIDPQLRISIWKELIRLRDEENKTIIVTTHVMDEAERCDCLTMIRNGVIITTGSPQKLIKDYNVGNLEEVFLKAGGINSENKSISKKNM